MKILIIALDQTYNFTVPLLEADGHEVLLLTKCGKLPLLYSTPRCKTYILEQLAEFEPSLIVNAIPSIFLPTSSEYTYIGNSALSARLETHKWETRQKAEELGFLLPTVLEECSMNTMASYSETTYLKPKGSDTHSSSIQVPANTTYTFPIDSAAYVEENLPHVLTACCRFTISGGAYHINRITGWTGGGGSKGMNTGADWTDSYTVVEIPSAIEVEFLAKCRTWLDYAVTLGGNYEGFFETAVTAANEFYWLEHNSRPSTYQEAFKSGTVQDWLDGLTTDPTKSHPTRYKIET
jgi:hypothetical protein|tara:strand:- start:658 stop:1539 length:882 start_codon:yes stop_codon:yes gene_type:complete